MLNHLNVRWILCTFCEIRKSISWISVVYDVFMKMNRKREHVFCIFTQSIVTLYYLTYHLLFVIQYFRSHQMKQQHFQLEYLLNVIFFYYFTEIVWYLFCLLSFREYVYVCVHAYIYKCILFSSNEMILRMWMYVVRCGCFVICSYR